MIVEQIDDIPLLHNQLDSIDLSNLLDSCFVDHGHWKGISGGKLGLSWLLYILSEGDHRLSHVESWGTHHYQTLKVLLDEPNLRRVDFSDDRLGILLDHYSDDSKWETFEQSLNSRILQVYDLCGKPNIIRTDSFNAPQFRSVGDLFTYGNSKQRRSDQPFCKVLVASLDRLSLPLVTEIEKGSGPDSNYYLGLIEKARTSLGDEGNLYVGDSQLGSFLNRQTIAKQEDYYLCPLGLKQCCSEKLENYLSELPCAILDLPSLFTEKENHRKSVYFYEVKECLSDEDSDFKWEERRILAYSPAYAEGLLQSFDNRLLESEEAIKNLVVSKSGRRNPKTLSDLHIRVAKIEEKYKVSGYFDIKYEEKKEEKDIRRHKNRPARKEIVITLDLVITRKTDLIESKRKKIGWQVYASNSPKSLISACDLVKCYRNQYRIEHLFDSMINKEVGLLPLYLKKENRIKGLIRFLSVAIRFTQLIQHQVRESLAKNKEKIGNIYPGNPGRKTDQPTIVMLLKSFKGISVVWLNSEVKMSSLKTIQLKILKLLNLDQLYQQFFQLLNTNFSLHET